MRTFTVVVFTALLSFGVLAQQLPDLTKEQSIAKMTDKMKSRSNPNEQVCGDYFTLNVGGHSDGINSGPALYYFIWIQKDANTRGLVANLFLQSKYVVNIVEAKKEPTAQQIYENGILKKIVVRISKPDYEKAKSCLPTPSIPEPPIVRV